jgi:hypothetical protein
VSGTTATDLRTLIAPELVEALERLVDERVAAALAERPADSEPTWLSLSEAAEYLRVCAQSLACEGRGVCACRMSAGAYS